MTAPAALVTPAVIVVTGVMAAGKSTVADELARRLDLSAHVRGDGFRRAIVRGRAEMSPPLSSAALAQLRLRQRLAALVADGYAAAGITAVVQDLYLGQDLVEFVQLLRHPVVYVVVLAPRPSVVADRDRARGKVGYAGWSVDEFDALLRKSTPRLGLWLDNSELTVSETVDAVLTNLHQARLTDSAAGPAPEPGP